MSMIPMDFDDSDVQNSYTDSSNFQRSYRYSNGLQIEYGCKSASRSSGENLVNVTWLRAFNDTPTVSVQLNTGRPDTYIGHATNVTSTTGDIGLYNTGSSVATGIGAHYVAIGRWKTI